MDFTKLYLSSPAYNCAGPINEHFYQFIGLKAALRDALSMDLALLIINDNSNDGTREVLDSLAEKHDFLRVIHNEKNMRNASNIVRGYTENLRLAKEELGGSADDKALIGCLDADGEHNPMLMLRHIKNYVIDGVPLAEIEERIKKSLVKDKWQRFLAEVPADGRVHFDGVVGSIIYPDHSISYQDATMMRFFGMMQSAQCGVAEPFYIQSPGWQLHRVKYLNEAVINLLPRYKIFFAGRNVGEEFPAWGLHGVIDDLVSIVGGKLYSAFLECYGTPPNRDLDKLGKQSDAAMKHGQTLHAFSALLASGYV